jgi:hypothetical protein
MVTEVMLCGHGLSKNELDKRDNCIWLLLSSYTQAASSGL